MMTIDILYHEACTYHPRTIQDVKHVLAEEGIEADVRLIDVTNEEEAQRRGFAGSPTIIINGEDIEPTSQQELGHTRELQGVPPRGEAACIASEGAHTKGGAETPIVWFRWLKTHVRVASIISTALYP